MPPCQSQENHAIILLILDWRRQLTVQGLCPKTAVRQRAESPKNANAARFARQVCRG